jgi:hypothetical protein
MKKIPQRSSFGWLVKKALKQVETKMATFQQVVPRARLSCWKFDFYLPMYIRTCRCRCRPFKKGCFSALSLIHNKKCSLWEKLPYDWEVRGHFTGKEMPVILVNRVVDTKRIIRRNRGPRRRGTRGWWPPPPPKNIICFSSLSFSGNSSFVSQVVIGLDIFSLPLKWAKLASKSFQLFLAAF